MISIFVILATLQAAPEVHRCGLSAIVPSMQTELATGISMRNTLRNIRSSRAANTTGTRLFTTSHFAIWYKLGIDADSLEAPWNRIPAKDSVPTLVRSIGIALENGWSYYVDTLGMRPPLTSSDDGVIAGAPPSGLYPVEICRPERALSSSYWNNSYYGLALQDPDNLAASRLFLSAKVAGSGWKYPLETGGLLNMDYTASDNWLKALQATAVHELFHAVEFRYETNLSHFLFEASSIAMEDLVLPDVEDHLYYLSALYGYNDSSSTTPMLQAFSGSAYRHALYMMGLVQDVGRDIIPKLWIDRAGRGSTGRGSILGTMRGNTTSATSFSWRESMIRYGQRILVAGKRRNWTEHWDTIPAFKTWDRSAYAPPLDKILIKPQTGDNSWTLGPGELKLLSDPAITGDLQVTWLPYNGAFLVRLDSTDNGFIRETFPTGITTIPAARRKTSYWIVGSDGTKSSDSTAEAYSSASASISFKRSTPTVPSTDECRLHKAFSDTAGDSISRNFGSSIRDSVVLEGCPITSHLSYIVQIVFKPVDDAQGRSLANDGVSFSLSSNPTLALQNVELSIPSTRWRFAYARKNDSWIRLSSRQSNGRTIVAWPTLSVAGEYQIILSSQSIATAPFPNPSVCDAPITFPLGTELDGLKLSIFAADGSLVRQWGSSELAFNTVWNLRNQYGFRVRPGVYTWVLHGSRNERGRLLVGR